jgi:trigger factor
MVGEVARSKAISIVLGKAVVTDEAGNAVDLSEFAAVQNVEDDSDIILQAEPQPTEDEAVESAAEAIAEANKPAKKAKKSSKKAADEADAE